MRAKSAGRRRLVAAAPAVFGLLGALSLAGIGADRTTIEIWADPTVTRNTHRIRVEATDLRYGLPGDTDHGFWGIKAGVGADNAILGEVEILRSPRDASGDAFRRFWSDMTGR
jgi:hypothetical protein